MKSNYYKDILKIATPISLGQLGNIFANMADSFMLGKYDTTHLAAASFAFNIFIPVLLFVMGFSIGTTSLVAQSIANNSTKEKAQIFKDSLITNMLFGLVAFVILIGLYFVLPYLGQEQEVVNLSGIYYLQLTFSILPLAIYSFLRQFIEGFGLTRPAMYFSFITNALNIFLNYLLIAGNWGFPELGIEGAGWATLISRILLPVLMLGYFIYKYHLRKIFLIAGKVKASINNCKNIIRISFPISVQLTIEVAAFASAAIFIGQFSKEQLAAHQIAINLASVSYIIISGFGAAATIMVGQFIGAKKINSIQKLTINFSVINVLFMTVMLLSFIILRNYLPQLYLNKEDYHIAEIAANLLIITGIFQLPDGFQTIMLGILRGMKDVKYPTLISIGAYVIFGIPFGYFLAHYYHLEEIGIWIGLCVGLLISATFLYLRVRAVQRKIFIRS